jgi:hypothetical protein
MRAPPLMRARPWAAAALLGFLGVAAPAAAADDAAGRWAVTASVAGHGFTLDCRFAQAAQRLSGACVDGPTGDDKIKGGRSHPLTKGSVNGNKVTFSYESSVGILPFGVDYTGVRDGDHITGQISALGKTGTFTANRTGP